MRSHLIEFTDRKLLLASRLSAGAEGGSYGDGILIISSLLAACASQLWPGRGIDKKRFVELWVRYADSNNTPAVVSVPLLLQYLAEAQGTSFNSQAESLMRSNPKMLGTIPGMLNDHIITGRDVDLDEAEVQRYCQDLSIKLLRRYSYPAIFYDRVRSAYVHEYRAGWAASPHAMSGEEGVVSYANTLPAPHRRIHFPVGWLSEVTRSIIRAVEPIWESGATPRPTRWWLSG
jgi:hypothetical protein